MIGLVYVEAHQKPPEGSALELEVKVWDYALAEVPTRHIPAVLKRAFAAKRDDYPMRSALVLREWDAMKEDLKRRNEEDALRLASGEPSKGPRMTLARWRDKHLAMCMGCDDPRFLIAHGRPESAAKSMAPVSVNDMRAAWQGRATEAAGDDDDIPF